MNLKSFKSIERAAYETAVLRLLDSNSGINNGKDLVAALVAQGLEAEKVRDLAIIGMLRRRVLELTEDKKFVRRPVSVPPEESKKRYDELVQKMKKPASEFKLTASSSNGSGPVYYNAGAIVSS